MPTNGAAERVCTMKVPTFFRWRRRRHAQLLPVTPPELENTFDVSYAEFSCFVDHFRKIHSSLISIGDSICLMKRVTQHGKNLITHNNEGKIKTFVKKKNIYVKKHSTI